MKLWKKICLKTVAFLLIFAVIFLGLQEVFRYKIENSEHLDIRLENMKEDVAGGKDFDVLYIGSSPIYAGVDPIVIWKEAGFTGMNLGISNQMSMGAYYMLRNALEINTPKVVVLDFNALCEERKADNEKFEVVYRKILFSIQSDELRNEMIDEIVRTNENQEWITYKLPFLRYHSRWTELNKEDFDDEEVTAQYQRYQKGALLRDKVEPYEESEYVPGEERAEITEYSLGYYRKFIDLCREKGIQIVAMSAPRVHRQDLAPELNAIAQLCEENDIIYLNYNLPELQEHMGIDHAQDFYNAGHLNVAGSIKLSRSLAAKLKEICDLPDRRDDPVYSSWNEDWDAFYQDYRETLQGLGY